MAGVAAFTPEAAGYGEDSLLGFIVEEALRRIREALNPDVAVAGAGPAGLTAAWLLAEKGFRVTVFERRLGVGGGMRGGSALLPVGLLAEGSGAELARRAGVRLREAAPGVYTVDPTELTVKLAARAVEAGAVVIPGAAVEDLIVDSTQRPPRVRGLVVNLAPALEAGWHVDPLYAPARASLDATGHDAVLLRILEKRFPGLIRVPGMSSLDVWRGEELVVEKTGEVVPGLYAAGMSVAELYNLPRMGPIFSGMLASGARAARLIEEALRG